MSIILSGGVSLAASLVFLLMGAPDVAMTEAAIGVGSDHRGLPLRHGPGHARPDEEDADPLGAAVKRRPPHDAAESS
ncbi:MAG: DUF4040 domain-containing protein [Chromatiales bacterium]|nr:DUF4040 domain-containing protein [Chromatiales bacterium]